MNVTSQKKTANLDAITKENRAKLDSLTSTAARIRFLASLKMSTGDISRYMTAAYPDKPVRYQWVRNVLLQPLKKA